jgi:mannosyltransferase OCH1-like enzyme
MNLSIPKIIHQIWIGPNPEPVIWTNTIKQNYIKKYPEYQYILWNENNINSLFDNFPIIKSIYDKTTELNGKSDILRYLILFIHGGIYIDADSVWLNDKNFDDLINNSCGFFAAKEPQTNIIVGGVIGSFKNNDVFKLILNHIENYVKVDGEIKLKNYVRLQNIKGISKILGPVLFDSYAKKMNITIFPSNYFYPISWHGIVEPDYHLKNEMPRESFLFQYGYTTNNFFNKI